jgi:hypothetical protein
LSFDGIGGSSIEAFDHEILFDPFEEKLYFPSGFVQSGDGFGGKKKIIR